MAVTQISRIQHRRGLEQDLPQLASAELGWSIDTRQLYIGNGTLSEGAPTEGITRILTQYDIDDITSNLAFVNYTFIGNAAGYTAQTGGSLTTPVVRSYQQKLDDFVNVRDFGAVGDGITDDTAAINRTIQQVYRSDVSPTERRARRTIYFPGGTYRISNTILIPTFARLVGDGIASANITMTQGNRPVANICDSSFQSGLTIGSSSAVLPRDIDISGLNFFNSNGTVSSPLFVIDSATNVKISTTKIQALQGTLANLVVIKSSVQSTFKVTFDGCQFLNAAAAIVMDGSGVTGVRVTNSGFDNITVGTRLLDSIGFVSSGNFYGNVTYSYLGNGNNANYSLGDTHFGTTGEPVPLDGVLIGNLQIATTSRVAVTSSSPEIVVPVDNTCGKIDYVIRNGVALRTGTIFYTNRFFTGPVQIEDSYIETSNSANANISANTNSIIISVTSGTATLQYNQTVFIE